MAAVMGKFELIAIAALACSILLVVAAWLTA